MKLVQQIKKRIATSNELNLGHVYQSLLTCPKERPAKICFLVREHKATYSLAKEIEYQSD